MTPLSDSAIRFTSRLQARISKPPSARNRVLFSRKAFWIDPMTPIGHQ
jgi:hypothetical protein